MAHHRTLLALSPILALALAAVSAQPSPDQFFGKEIGADRTLVAYPDIARYFTRLDHESARVKVTEEGKSTGGLPLILAFISSERNIENLPRLIEINRRLAAPEGLDPAAAAELVPEARVFVLITATIHSTEIAASQMAMLFAHALATTDAPGWKTWLDNVVVLLMPSINPDGNVMVTEWYQKHLGTEHEACRMPWLYHSYAGHDNNRDFYMLNLAESRVVNAVLHRRYFAHVFLDMHQMGSTGPRMFVPPFMDPLNQNLDPVLLRETDLIGTFMGLKLQEHGKQGVASAYAFDAYWPGGTKNTSWYKNVVGILTEMASVKIATPIHIEPNELQGSRKGLPDYRRQVNFPDPWPGGWWRLRDIIDYEMIAAEALVEVASQNRRSFVRSFYELGRRNVRRGETEAPYAWVLPPEQWDPPCAATFCAKMSEHGVKLLRLAADHRAGDRHYRRGSVVIPMNQAYRSFIQVMMETQNYPEVRYMTDGPIIEPYDATGWTLPLQMGVAYRAVDTPVRDWPLEARPPGGLPPATLTGSGATYRIPARCNRSAIVVNRLLKKKVPVSRFTASPGAGDFLVPSDALPETDIVDALKGTGISVTRTTIEDGGNTATLSPPRIAIYQSYRASMDEGWTRWVLDHFEFSYTVIHNKDFKDGDLGTRFDVILFPDQSRETIVEGRSSRRAYRRANLPPEYQGGIGKEGVEALEQFVKKGGTVVLLDSAYELAIEDFKLPLTNVLKDVKRDAFYCPGSILRIHVDTGDPLGWGLEDKTILFFSRSPAFRTRVPGSAAVDRKVVARFGADGPHRLSGYLKGGELLNRTAAIVRFRYHDGRVVVLGGRVQHRSQTFATFKFLFNALYLAGLR